MQATVFTHQKDIVSNLYEASCLIQGLWKETKALNDEQV